MGPAVVMSNKVGKRVKIDTSHTVTCKVVKLPFYDPEGARQEL